MLEKKDLEAVRKTIGSKTLKPTGERGGGCISEGGVYETDSGPVFIKYNAKPEASGVKQMFEGESASLAAIVATDTVKAPKPIQVIELEGGAGAFVMESLEIKGSLNRRADELGDKLAQLHLKNKEMFELEQKGEKSVHKKEQVPAVTQFGFDVTTCCGYLPQNNEWVDTWEAFFARKIQEQIDRLQVDYSDKIATELWEQVKVKLPKFFEGLDIFPALLHGDLWGGNAAETADGPVVFDPASFYGHAEYDLAISCMFGGFPEKFFSAYHHHIPREKNFEKRQELYKLFHYLNHWNHFGGGYQQSSIHTLNKLIKLNVG